jgi:hypothetical protein
MQEFLRLNLVEARELTTIESYARAIIDVRSGCPNTPPDLIRSIR